MSALRKSCWGDSFELSPPPSRRLLRRRTSHDRGGGFEAASVDEATAAIRLPDDILRSLALAADAFCPGSDRGVLLCPGRVCGVEFPVALFDAASPFVSGKDDADVVRASAFACSGNFLLRFAGCQDKDLIPQGR